MNEIAIDVYIAALKKEIKDVQESLYRESVDFTMKYYCPIINRTWKNGWKGISNPMSRKVFADRIGSGAISTTEFVMLGGLNMKILRDQITEHEDKIATLKNGKKKLHITRINVSEKQFLWILKRA